MQAARFYTGRDIRVEEVPDPVPGPGQVLIRVRSAGVCGSDLHTYRSGKLRYPELAPCTPGHELSGEVVGLGDGVEDLVLGQRVAVEPLVGCGSCPNCRSGSYHLCPDLRHIGHYYPGGFAEMTVAPHEKVFPLPDGLDYDAGSIADVYACAVHAMHRAPVSLVTDVLVIGGGAIGLTTAQAAKAAGARRVYVMATQPQSIAAASQLGADAVINPRAEDPIAAVMDLTGGRGVDIVYEAVGGATNTLELALSAVARGGTLGVLGFFPGPVALPSALGLRKEVSLLWIYSYQLWNGVPEFQVALDLMAAGRVDPHSIITHSFPLFQIGQAYQAALDKGSSGAIKVVIRP